MHLFDTNGQIRKFPTPLTILHTYFPVRLSYYTQRRTALLTTLQQQLSRLAAKSQFIRLVTSGAVRIVGVKRSELVEVLRSEGLMGEGGGEGLLDLRVSAFSVEEVERLESEKVRCEAEVKRVEALTAEQMWEADLNRLEARLVKMLDSAAEQDTANTKRLETSERREKRAVKATGKSSKERHSGGREDKRTIKPTAVKQTKQLQ